MQAKQLLQVLKHAEQAGKIVTYFRQAYYINIVFVDGHSYEDPQKAITAIDRSARRRIGEKADFPTKDQKRAFRRRNN